MLVPKGLSQTKLYALIGVLVVVLLAGGYIIYGYYFAVPVDVNSITGQYNPGLHSSVNPINIKRSFDPKFFDKVKELELVDGLPLTVDSAELGKSDPFAPLNNTRR